MPLFRIKAKQVARIAPQEHRIKEEVIHRLIEGNLSKFFEDLIFVARKPRIGGKEFDTLALDRSTKVPVIIEYKRAKDRGVVEQVSLYYVKLKHNKSDMMILLDQEGVTGNLGEIDFDNPQIIIVAREFTPEQRELLTLMRNYLRLYTYQLYGDGIVSLEEVEPLVSSWDFAGRVRRSRGVAGGPYEIDHFGMKAEIRKLYERLDKAITSLDSRVKPAKINKYFIGYGATGPYFCIIYPRVNSIWVGIKCARTPSSPRGVKVSRVGKDQHTPMTHEFQISSEGQVNSAVRLIKTAFEDSM